MGVKKKGRGHGYHSSPGGRPKKPMGKKTLGETQENKDVQLGVSIWGGGDPISKKRPLARIH